MNAVAAAVDANKNTVSITRHRHVGRKNIGRELQGVAVAGGGIAIRDLVLPRTPSKQISIVPGLTVQIVLARATVENIVAVASVERVRTSTAAEHIVADAAIQHIVAVAAP